MFLHLWWLFVVACVCILVGCLVCVFACLLPVWYLLTLFRLGFGACCVCLVLLIGFLVCVGFGLCWF